MNRYEKSAEWLARARKVTPGGAQTLSKMAERFPEGAYPAFLKYGNGAKVWDVDGNEYVDWICGLGAVTLGYKRYEVEETVYQDSINPTLSLPSTLEVEVAERLVDLIPCAEMVRFCKTGSEAAEGAIRVARAITGRDVILSCGYHSWHSWYAAMQPEHPGVPDLMELLAIPFDYNDIASFHSALVKAEIATHGRRQPAAVIIEPTLIDPPAPGFLETVAEETRKAGAVLIFDETVTGFRWHKSGYQAVCGITPDMAIFGKGMGNGHPIAAICGSRAVMEDYGRLVSGTFGGELTGLAAAKAVIDVYNKEDIPGVMKKWGDYLFVLFGKYLTGQSYHPKWKFNPEEMAVFLEVTAEHGALFHPGGFNINSALTTEDWEQTVLAIDWGIDVVKSGAKQLGKPLQSHPFRKTQ